jgi:hypothetical protein
MEQQTLGSSQISTRLIYSNREIYVGTFLGGPLVAGYLISENFKSFDETGNAKKALIYAIVATIAILGTVILVPEKSRFFDQIIPITYTIITYYLVKHFQGQKITAHINAGGQIYSWWRTIGASIIGLLISLILILGIYYFLDRTSDLTTTTTKIYGVMKNEIDYNKDNISEKEVDNLAEGLTKTTFFDEEATKYIFVKKAASSYEIYISCNKSVTNTTEALSPFIQLRSDMQSLFPKNKIVFNLVVDNLDNVVKRLE